MKPILCLDFDGVLHSYASGWQGADVVKDPPVDDAMMFLCLATEVFNIQIYSSRSSYIGGIKAMKEWIHGYYGDMFGDEAADRMVNETLVFPREKPPAFLTIDDRAYQFTGEFPDVQSLLKFKPWNKK